MNEDNEKCVKVYVTNFACKRVSRRLLSQPECLSKQREKTSCGYHDTVIQ